MRDPKTIVAHGYDVIAETYLDRHGRSVVRDRWLGELIARLAAVERQSAAQAAARKVQQIVDQGGHARNAAPDQPEDILRSLIKRRPQQQCRSGVDRRKRIAQVMAEDGDELLTQLGGLGLVQKVSFARGQTIDRIQMCRVG
jgi:hypothetical protein